MRIKSSMLDYLQDFRVRMMRVIIIIAILIVFCLTFKIEIIEFYGYKIVLPYPNLVENISLQLIQIMKEMLLPQNVTLIQTAPGQAFFVQIYVSFILSMILAMPIIIKELCAFIGPALYKKEKKVIKNAGRYALLLFLAGCLFAYFIVIPYMLDFLYEYGESIGVLTFFQINEFIPFIMQFLISFGFSYQLPVIIWATTESGIVGPTFWKNNFRYAIVIVVIFGAIITPDGSGVTMWFIAGPMILLYLIGMLFVDMKVKRK